MITLPKYIIAAASLLAASTALCLGAAGAKRGYNISTLGSYDSANDEVANYRQTDWNQMKADGCTVVRVSFAFDDLGYFSDGQSQPNMSTNNLKKMKAVIRMAAQAGLNLIIDPHDAFGTRSDYTMFPEDQFWYDNKYKNQWAELLKNVANEIKLYENANNIKNTVWAIQTLNEASPRRFFVNKGLNPIVDLNDANKLFTKKIRESNKRIKIIHYYHREDFKDMYPKKPTWFNPTGDTGAASKIHYDNHPYWPSSYSLQGETPRKQTAAETDREWPDANPGDGVFDFFTTAKQQERMDFIETWRNDPSINVQGSRILFGEFGCTQGTSPYRLAWDGNVTNPQNGGRIFLKTIYDHAYAHGYNFCYHTFKSSVGTTDARYPVKRYNFVKKMIQNTAPNNLP